MDNNFYVYQHITTDTNEIFYVGKGRDGNGRRAYNKSTRSKLWKSIVNRHDYRVDIVKRGLTEQEAFDLESRLIQKIGRRDLNTGTLCNFTDGGEGVSGRQMSSEEREKRTQKSREVASHPSFIEKMKQVNKNTAMNRYSRKFAVYKAIMIEKKGWQKGPKYIKGDFVGFWTHKKTCAQELGLYWTGISQVLNGQIKQYRHYIFEYVENK